MGNEAKSNHRPAVNKVKSTAHHKELVKEVRRLLSNRAQYTEVSKKRKVFLYGLFYAGIWATAASFAFGYQLFNGTNETRLIDAIYMWLWGASIFLASLLFIIFGQSLPKEEEKQNLWFLRRGRLIVIIGLAVFSIQILNQMLPTDLNFFGGQRLMVAIGHLCYAIFFLTVIVVLSRPERFLDERLTNIASGCFAYAIATGPTRIFSAAYPQDTSFWIAWLLPLILLSLMSLLQKRNPKRLNYVQYAVISIMNPATLLHALRSHDEVIRDQYNALAVKMRLEKGLPLGVQKELIRLMVEDNKSSREVIWWVVPIATTLFIVLAESIINDLVYEDLLKPFICRYINSICD